MIDVIIPTKNSTSTLKECLTSLKKQKELGKIIIVDGHSIDNTLQVAQEFGCEIYFEPETKNNRKSAEARNEGLKHSESILVAFVDTDTIVPESWMQDLVKYFKEPSIAGVTSGCEWKGGSDESLAISKVIQFGSSHAKNFNKIIEVESVPTYNAIYSRETLNYIRPNLREVNYPLSLKNIRPQIFDESLGGCEDWELNFRLRMLGLKLLGVPDSPVEHRERPTWISFWKQMFHYAWARARVTKLKKIFIPKFAIPSLGLITLLIFCIFSPILALISVGAYLFGTSVLSLFVARSLRLFRKVFVALNILIISWALGYIKGFLF